MGSVPKFEFTPEVSAVFDDMIRRSVPLYEENLKMTANLANTFCPPGALIYDLGSATGAVAAALCDRFNQKGFHYIGIDNSEAMVEKGARQAKGAPKNANIEFVCGDIETHSYKPADLMVAAYTFQFIAPSNRGALLKKVYEALKPGGVFLFSEKVTEESGEISRAFVELHLEMKKGQGYSELEISQKRDSLENVLVPFETSRNLEILKEAGFHSAAIYFKWHNFASFIALKK